MEVYLSWWWNSITWRLLAAPKGEHKVLHVIEFHSHQERRRIHTTCQGNRIQVLDNRISVLFLVAVEQNLDPYFRSFDSSQRALKKRWKVVDIVWIMLSGLDAITRVYNPSLIANDPRLCPPHLFISAVSIQIETIYFPHIYLVWIRFESNPTRFSIVWHKVFNERLTIHQ